MGMAENTRKRGREQAGMSWEGRRTMEKVLENTVRDTQEQISVSLRVTELLVPILRATIIMDQEQLNSNILSMLPDDPVYKAHLVEPRNQWSVTLDGFLRQDNLIYIPDTTSMITYSLDIPVKTRL